MDLYPRLMVAALVPLGVAALTFALYVAILPATTPANAALGPGMAVAVATGGILAMLLAATLNRRQRHAIAALIERVAALRRGERIEDADLNGELGSLDVAIHRLYDEAAAQRNALEVERQRAERILDRMAEGVMLVDDNGRVEFINPAGRELFALPSDSGGQSVGEATGSHRVQVAVSRAAATREVQHDRITLAGPPPRTLQLTAVAVPTQRGNGVVAVFNDVTELQRAIEVRREFVANASHELKTPVSAIKGAAETLQNGALDDPNAAHRFVDNIQRNAVRLTRLTEDLLSLSRLEAHAEPLDLAAIVHDLCVAFRQGFVAAGLELHCHAAPGLPLWHGNRRAVEQVLSNLMDNARAYTPEGGEVEVTVGATVNGFELRVRDTGIGIEARHLPRLFERFYRVDPARSRDAGGTGLGPPGRRWSYRQAFRCPGRQD